MSRQVFREDKRQRAVHDICHDNVDTGVNSEV